MSARLTWLQRRRMAKVCDIAYTRMLDHSLIVTQRNVRTIEGLRLNPTPERAVEAKRLALQSAFLVSAHQRMRQRRDRLNRG